MQVDLNRFKKTNVLIAGDLMLDTYWHGDTSRISPEAPVPVVAVNKEESRPGGAANAALNVAALGAQANLVGIVGRDDAATTLTRLLDGAEIRHDLSIDEHYRTITKLRLISRHQQLIRADFEASPSAQMRQSLGNQFNSRLADADIVILSDYGKGALLQCRDLITEAKQRSVPVLVDPKGTDFSRYRHATLLTPNMAEFEAVAGQCRSEDDIINKALSLIHEHQIESLLITRSEHGMTLVKQSGEYHHFPAQAKEVFDVTGAGDTVISTLAVAIASGLDLETSVALANVAAGIVVGKLGTATTTAAELKLAIDADHDLERGMMSFEQLREAVSNARAAGKRIVFTNGCFDILHAGHVGYLQDAKRLGDRLIVAINDDASVSRLKGPNRPVNGLDRRMRVLSALKSVDWVISFSEDTPEPLIEALKPNVLVKGGDYSLDQVVGADIVTRYGGDIRVLSVEDNCSTTATIEKIRKS
ncbi:D-heptose-7- phosphate 1-kinase,D-heptose-1-phosphate adenylyltransferase [Oleiphilus messinensis]|uniref:Bifunctional protein HldE n=1 Tax=Oleiphilus messinensis TaxID=141451 RepID=A0A1Y0I356_9GAMM|nr:bifunctional D-glycero-beta-D-manno-heptose-7-phosphate kinase/D-glycero-beta-D-manno-heptose 1-phosphate adenylyltransferase HldE [Oleiphilus messinensis]ARU54841.1 D-heptose-7- phosphate 1-kinase,D-heptose-1-phosphate adenylyltransferase [Oleiphilus messinensis]